jgi:hypothetical protein
MPEELNPEQRIMRRYIELGQIAKNATDERDNIKDSEIIPAMQDGIFFSDEDQYLAFQFETRTSFDWESAVASGDIPALVVARYMKPAVIRKVVVKKKADESKKAVAAQQLLVQSKAQQLADAVSNSLGESALQEILAQPK